MKDIKQYRVKCDHCKRIVEVSNPDSDSGYVRHCPKCNGEITFISSYRGCEHNPAHMWTERGKCVSQSAKENAAKSKRGRTVYPSDEIPHLWMHKATSSARNPQNNLFFRDSTIYSYGGHFPIARHIANKAKQTAILFTTRTHSVTTAKHLGMVRSAIPNSEQVFNVPVLEDSYIDAKHGRTIDHTRNLENYIAEVANLVSTSARARAAYRKESSHRSAVETRNEYLAYLKFFKLGKSKIPPVPALNSKAMETLKAKESAKAAAKALETKKENAARDAEQAKICTHTPKHTYAQRWECERITREIDEEIAFTSKRDAWKRGEIESLPGAYSRSPLLRVIGDEVQTSRGARFPVQHAKRGLALVRSVIARGEDWKTNGHTLHLGHYKVQSIEANGTVHAGCHVVPYSEIESIAEQLDAYTAVDTPEVSDNAE